MSGPDDLTILGVGSDEPASFMGPPGALAGDLDVANPSAKKRYFRGCSIRVAGDPAAPPVSATPTMLVGIEPGGSARVRLRACVDASTPPGVLRGDLTLGAEHRPAVLYVTEFVELEISPDTLVIEAPPGAKVTKVVVLRNRGNVPLSFREPRPVTLEKEPRPEQTIAGLLDSFRDARVASPPGDEAAPLFARLSSAALDLAPAKLASIEFTIELPEGLEPGTRYLGRAPLYSATLTLIVVTTGQRGTQS